MLWGIRYTIYGKWDTLHGMWQVGNLTELRERCCDACVLQDSHAKCVLIFKVFGKANELAKGYARLGS